MYQSGSIRSIRRGLILLGAALLLTLGVGACGPQETLDTSDSAKATFDWGGDCESGTGSFNQSIAYRDTVLVGQVPAGKRDAFFQRTGGVADIETDIP